MVIYGPSGVGKTHLMLAIKNHMKKVSPYKKIEYIRSEEFTNQGLGESHSPETDKLALSITEMINAATKAID